MATCILADMGADVIKIEHPVRGDGYRGHKKFWGVSLDIPGGSTLAFEIHNRNKRGITLNLANPKGRDAVYRLVKKCDVFATCYGPALSRRLGIDYASIKAINPEIVYASGSAFGRKGPAAEAQGFDWGGLGRAGLYHRVMGPEMVQTNLIDGLADQSGAVMLGLGIVAALLARQTTKEGQEVQSSLLGTIINLQRNLSLEFALWTGKEPPKLERSKTRSPLQNLYRCQDGRWLALMLMQSDRFWPDFCRAVGLESLIRDPKFVDQHARSRNAEELVAILDKTFAARRYAEWEPILTRADLLFSPINTLPEVGNDPQALENEYIIEYEHPRLGKFKSGGFPISFGETPCAVRNAAPELGQHTEEVLRQVGGYSCDEISNLRSEGAL